MDRITTLFLTTLSAILLFSCDTVGAPAVPAAVDQPTPEWVAELTAQLNRHYRRFRNEQLTDRRFKPNDVQLQVHDLPDGFTAERLGNSVEGRPIYRVTWGEGPTKVLLWSQMHGDEPTATAALFDLFRFLGAENDSFAPIREKLARELTLVAIPMLNPDGADRFQRRNALGIDLNRDALRLSQPESQLLKAERDRLRADWGFNLHDQSRFYAAGYPSGKLATISFLAPAYNFEKEVNEVRGRAINLIGLMNAALQPYAPGQIARYNDDFEPRAFGDNMQKWGTSTILIESGGYPDDREKQEIRRLNFIALVTGLYGIATGDYQAMDRGDYESIPFNESNAFYDLLVREVTLEREGRQYSVDIGYHNNEVSFNGNRGFYFRSAIADLGDLSTFSGYEELPPQNLRAQVGKKYPDTVTAAQLRQLNPQQLYRQGYTAVVVSDWSPALAAEYDQLHLLRENDRLDTNILPGLNPDLLLYDGRQMLKYAVVNGKLFQVR